MNSSERRVPQTIAIQQKSSLTGIFLVNDDVKLIAQTITSRVSVYLCCFPLAAKEQEFSYAKFIFTTFVEGLLVAAAPSVVTCFLVCFDPLESKL